MKQDGDKTDNKAAHITVALRAAMLAKVVLDLCVIRERGMARVILRQVAGEFDELAKAVETLPVPTR